MSRTNGDHTTVYVGGLLEVDLDAVGVSDARAFYAFGGISTVVRAHDSDDTVFVVQDRLGPIAAAFNDNTNTRSSVRYRPWGTERSTSGALPSDHLFTGQISDDTKATSGGTGLLFYTTRYYDSGAGVFTQPDEAIPRAMDPVSYNRYAYVSNNPANRIDQSGHDDADTQGPDLGIDPAEVEALVGRFNALTADIQVIGDAIRRAEANGDPTDIGLYRALNLAAIARNDLIADIRAAAPQWVPENSIVFSETPTVRSDTRGFLARAADFVGGAAPIVSVALIVASPWCGPGCVVAAGRVATVGAGASLIDTVQSCIADDAAGCYIGLATTAAQFGSAGLSKYIEGTDLATTLGRFSLEGGVGSLSEAGRRLGMDPWNPTEEEIADLRAAYVDN